MLPGVPDKAFLSLGWTFRAPEASGASTITKADAERITGGRALSSRLVQIDSSTGHVGSVVWIVAKVPPKGSVLENGPMRGTPVPASMKWDVVTVDAITGERLGEMGGS